MDDADGERARGLGLASTQIEDLDLLILEGYLDLAEVRELLAEGNVAEIEGLIEDAGRDRREDREAEGGRTRAHGAA